MAYPINYVLIPFEGNINTVDTKGVNIYLRATKEIYMEAERLDISVSNAKYIIDHFISIANKYGWGRLSFMVKNSANANIIFREVYQIQLAGIHH